MHLGRSMWHQCCQVLDHGLMIAVWRVLLVSCDWCACSLWLWSGDSTLFPEDWIWLLHHFPCFRDGVGTHLGRSPEESIKIASQMLSKTGTQWNSLDAAIHYAWLRSIHQRQSLGWTMDARLGVGCCQPLLHVDLHVDASGHYRCVVCNDMYQELAHFLPF